MKKLERATEELRSLPRHLWDDYLWNLCEEMLSETANPPLAERGIANPSPEEAEQESRLTPQDGS